MKEIIIKYKDSRVLEVLKSLAVHLNFSISEMKESKGVPTPTEENKAKAFVNQWAGFLKHPDSDNAKFDYLSKKYK